MIDINDDILLRKILMKHFTEPINKGLKNNKKAIIKDAKSQTCADEMQIEILIENDIFKEISFEGTACAVATSSADIFFELIINKSKSDVKKIINQYKIFLNTGEASKIELLDKLIVFKNINKQKNRILCANLAIDAINEIIE
ncbi:FeS assembly protein [Mesoplasma entomophilum]|uniref:Iron-sulfur cluster assembly scaffold protein n=1 Tax=Mesoplasma entomophilum TaxID=2149 RepID=A0A3S5XYT0_9MOLU|nr:iron-sulfur cluster assembly scaffold protein [Mesoplasma entomophilum]ATQ35408.1 iron-sulfur cluster assembly scaffold protein [Mesoplasma entomophilum]ATZ19365.1 FeS assembly protein [Mesoplasma entomophilum]